MGVEADSIGSCHSLIMSRDSLSHGVVARLTEVVAKQAWHCGLLATSCRLTRQKSKLILFRAVANQALVVAESAES